MYMQKPAMNPGLGISSESFLVTVHKVWEVVAVHVRCELDAELLVGVWVLLIFKCGKVVGVAQSESIVSIAAD
jgi:hypothetical protein